MGSFANYEIEEKISKAIKNIREKIFENRISGSHYFLHFIATQLNACISEKITREKMQENLQTFIPKVKCFELSKLIMFYSNEIRAICTQRNPVLLLLDSKLNNFPFESIPIIKKNNQMVCRIPALPLLLNTCEKLNAPSKIIDTSKAFYILNPSKDLMNTQNTFQSYFSEKKRWNGITGQEPKEGEILRALEEYDLFLYCGHGAGEVFYSSEDVRGIDVKSSALLMGCSSSFFSDNGFYENNGIIMSYLGSGRYYFNNNKSFSPLVVGNLWDVTDKEIDRYLKSLLEIWIDEKVVDTDWTIKGRKAFLYAAIKARNACKLGFLIGAAPVCYGLPAYKI